MRARWWIGAIISLLTLAAIAAASEWALAKMNYRPTFRGGGNDHFNVTTKYGWAQLDPMTGWINKDGTALSMEPGHVKMTFWSHGRRATRADSEQRSGQPTAVILGDSISQGYGIVDQETYAYIVQQRYPNWNIENFATGGYGAYQSLLMLRKIYAEKIFKPKLVVYAFAGLHANRDVANYSWVESFINQNGEYFAPPNVTSRDNRLVEHPLTIYKAFPFEYQSRLVALLKKSYLKFLYGSRQKFADDVSKLLITEMRRLTESNGARFIIIRLTGGTTAVENYIKDNGITFVDCVVDAMSPHTKVGGVGHPNGIVHASWAKCLGGWMSQNLK